MFHLLFCSGPTRILYSSGCSASSRGLSVQMSASPAALWRWGRGALSPTGLRICGPPVEGILRCPSEGWVCRLQVVPPCSRETGGSGPPPRPDGIHGHETGQAFLRGCHTYAAAPTRLLHPQRRWGPQGDPLAGQSLPYGEYRWAYGM